MSLSQASSQVHTGRLNLPGTSMLLRQQRRMIKQYHVQVVCGWLKLPGMSMLLGGFCVM